MVNLITFAQTSQNADGIRHGRLADHYWLESALERCILLDVLSILVQSGGTNSMEFTTGKHRLQHIAGIHRALSCTCTNNGVELIDKQNDLAIGRCDLGQNGLESFLELAAELGSGDERAEIQRDDALVLQILGHISADNSLGESFGDCGLTNTRFTNENRIVLGAATQYLNDATDFFIPANDRVEFAKAGNFGEITAILLQCLVFAFRIRIGHALAAANLVECGHHTRSLNAVTAQQRFRRRSLNAHDAEQQVLGADVFVTKALGLGFSVGESLTQSGAHDGIRADLQLRSTVDEFGDFPANDSRIYLHALDNLGNNAIGLINQSSKECFRLVLCELLLFRDALAIDDRFTGFIGVVLVLCHVCSSPEMDVKVGRGWQSVSESAF